MKTVIIPDPSGNGHYNMTHMGEFEYANPIEKIREAVLNHHIAIDQSFVRLKPELFSEFDEMENKDAMMDKVMMKRALSFWNNEYERIIVTPFPKELTALFGTNKKKDQERLLKNVTLTTAGLIAFIFTAWEKFGYSYSVYESHHLPTGSNWEELPLLAEKDDNDGSIISVGSTSLSNGQMKSVIEQRKVVIAKFLDKGNEWHCFFLTYNSISGKEAGDTPHIHYISHAWGFSREQAVAELKNRRYNFPWTVHIPYTRGEEGD